jgi:hypothetical protein
MSRSLEYLRNAASCLRVAERTTELAARAELIKMAHAWQRLAEQANRNSKLDLVYETPAKSEQQPATQQQLQIQPDGSDPQID